MSTVPHYTVRSEEVTEAAVHGAGQNTSQNSVKQTEQPRQPSNSTADAQEALQPGGGTAHDATSEQQCSALIAARGPYQIMMLQAKQHARYSMISCLFFSAAKRTG